MSSTPASQRLSDHVAVVTGAASGIGRATVARLVAEGASVLACDITEDALDTSVTEALEGSRAGGSAIAHPLDVSDEVATAAAIEAVIRHWGRLDGLVNAAGIHATVRTHDCDLTTWERVLRVNAGGTFLLCRAALPHLRASRGAIVNFSSTSARFGHPWMAAYAASKGAISSLSQSLAVEYALDGVRVNCVAPGSVDTGITSGVTFPDDLSKRESRLVHRIMSPTGFGEPADVAGVIAMLLSADGAHITGETIRIDGGTHA